MIFVYIIIVVGFVHAAHAIFISIAIQNVLKFFQTKKKILLIVPEIQELILDWDANAYCLKAQVLLILQCQTKVSFMVNKQN